MKTPTRKIRKKKGATKTGPEGLKFVVVSARNYGNRLKGTRIYYEGSKPGGLRPDGTINLGKNINRRTARKISLNKYPFTPSTYPGRRPRFSFLFTSQGLYPIEFPGLDQVLSSRNLPAANRRYAVLAYGSNACPGQLLEKRLGDVPVLYGQLAGAAAVYANRQTKRGYVPATLVRAWGSRSSWITLLTAEQIRVMDRSEGRPNIYVLAELPKVQFSVGEFRITPLYSYVGIDGGVMVINGKPVSLHSMAQKRANIMRSQSSTEDACKWLDFQTIAYPDPPSNFSLILPRRP